MYDYETVTSAGTFSQSRTSYMIPNGWIVDLVNMAPSETFQWLTGSEKLDAGYAYVAPTGSDVTRFGKAVRRKTKATMNGLRMLQDTNNSSDDFEYSISHINCFGDRYGTDGRVPCGTVRSGYANAGWKTDSRFCR